MCGFFCLLGKNAHELSKSQIDHINLTLKHRGPDDYQTLKGENFNTLFWRLSIVDQDLGKQPMTSLDKKLTLLFNGEIYNYQEIRSQIKGSYNFQTNSDTEVILAAFIKWGIKCFDYFEGMFAITIIDHFKKKVYLVRDVAGVKPLYYLNKKEDIYISSEYKVLLTSGISEKELDRKSLDYYHLFQTVPNKHTLIKDIKKIFPGEIKCFDLNNGKEISTSRIKIRDFQAFSNYNEYRNKLEEEIYYQMKLATNTDLPTGYHLSGGIDSNTLISITKKIRKDENFFFVTSIIDDEIDQEINFIKEAARVHDRELNVVKINKDSFFNVLEKVIYQLDEPVGDPGVVAQYLVNQEISKKAKIVYSGQGFDELFFGYARNLSAYVISKYGLKSLINKDRSVPDEINHFFDGWNEFNKDFSLMSDLSPEKALFIKLCRINPYLLNKNMPHEFTERLKKLADLTFNEFNENSKNFSSFMFNVETSLQLPSLLQMEDRASMAHSVETRVPFCTNSILGLAKAGEIEWIFRNNQTKGVIKDIVKDILPKVIINRKTKVGRPMPFSKWFKSDKILLKKLYASKELVSEMYGSNDIIDYALNHKNPYDRTLWSIWSLILWTQLYNISV